jgi:hypothetical protein
MLRKIKVKVIFFVCFSDVHEQHRGVTIYVAVALVGADVTTVTTVFTVVVDVAAVVTAVVEDVCPALKKKSKMVLTFCLFRCHWQDSNP